MSEIVATFSIAALDPETESLGVAVQSKFLAVGAVVPWARAGVGAVATQAMANFNYGPRGLGLMAEGGTAEETVEALISADEGRDHRQLGVVDARGRAATFTGPECFDWAGGVTGEHYAAQGNILVGPETVDAMARAYEGAEGDLAARILAALDAGQEAGGDSRGQQSAAIVVERAGAEGLREPEQEDARRRAPGHDAPATCRQPAMREIQRQERERDEHQWDPSPVREPLAHVRVVTVEQAFREAEQTRNDW